MYLKPDSLAVVLLGDWCNLYSKPDWLADNIFKSPDIEIGVNAQDNVTNISCKQGPVIIRPSQAKVAFMTTDIDETTLDYLEECVKKYLETAHTPLLNAFGFNIDYYEEENPLLADIFDSMADVDVIIDADYEIESTRVRRALKKDDAILNMEYSIDKSETLFHFNKHYEGLSENNISHAIETITKEKLTQFLRETRSLIEGLGYDFEEDNNE